MYATIISNLQYVVTLLIFLSPIKGEVTFKSCKMLHNILFLTEGGLFCKAFWKNKSLKQKIHKSLSLQLTAWGDPTDSSFNYEGRVYI